MHTVSTEPLRTPGPAPERPGSVVAALESWEAFGRADPASAWDHFNERVDWVGPLLAAAGQDAAAAFDGSGAYGRATRSEDGYRITGDWPHGARLESGLGWVVVSAEVAAPAGGSAPRWFVTPPAVWARGGVDPAPDSLRDASVPEGLSAPARQGLPDGGTATPDAYPAAVCVALGAARYAVAAIRPFVPEPSLRDAESALRQARRDVLDTVAGSAAPATEYGSPGDGLPDVLARAANVARHVVVAMYEAGLPFADAEGDHPLGDFMSAVTPVLQNSGFAAHFARTSGR
ncbi:hypothetical protein SAMN05216223_118143 [Actinacidiphila yanglinensis]|uniref:Uncharacterized protein n=1 Tax=Actinacidiphila yanglinensis TaxID=310779 RepID=A0A1H6DRI3_9ACTN|nr:hypothetical protein SAMN05216223_118143 [Actinacidiphila yanglinensis]